MKRAAQLWLSVLLAAACEETPPVSESACAELEKLNLWTIDAIPAGTNCQNPPEPRDVSGEAKLAVAVYHFNVQYVAGGLKGFPDGTANPVFDLDETQVEDRIVRQGLEPVLDMFLANPTFAADIEMQAYTLEVVARRHPDVLVKLQTLAQRGQIDVDSFHYSDQLYIAYPRIDLEKSLDLTKEVFDRTCVPLGKSIFTQEGQFARGQLPLAQERGYEVSVLPKNLFRYQFGDAPLIDNVLYVDPSAPEHAVIIGAQHWSKPDAPGGPFELAWTFMNDGEIAFTEGNLNPYFGTEYVADPSLVAEHVQQLRQMEAQGFKHVTIREAVRAMKKRGIVPAPLPPVLDGVWQPDDTLNVFRWMGGPGLFRPFERDADVLATIWRARSTVEQADRVLGSNQTPLLQKALKAAWREVMLAEVSDSTGWNPFKNEVDYSVQHSSRAGAIAALAITCAELELAPRTIPQCLPTDPVSADAIGVEVIVPSRQLAVEIEQCGPALVGSETYLITIVFPKLAESEPYADPNAEISKQREMEVTFTRTASSIEHRGALSDTPSSHPLSAYTFDEIAIPLPTGVLALGGNRWVVQDHTRGRTAVIIRRTGEDRGKVRFRDMTVSRAVATQRRFYLISGAGEAEVESFARLVQQR